MYQDSLEERVEREAKEVSRLDSQINDMPEGPEKEKAKVELTKKTEMLHKHEHQAEMLEDYQSQAPQINEQV